MKNFDVPDLDNNATYYIVDSMLWRGDKYPRLDILGGPYKGLKAATEAFCKYAKNWEDNEDVEIDVPHGYIGMDDGNVFHSIHLAGSLI